MSSSGRRNVFVFGLDDFHREDLEALPRADHYRFHGLLSYDEATRADLYPVDEMLEKATRQLEDFDGSIDAIVTHWDFPSTVMLPIVRDRLGHPGPTVEAVLACEHKYWSRLEQASVIPDAVPDFAAVNPFSEAPLEQVDFDYPFWLKPVTAHSSNLGFRIDGPDDFEHALPRIRDKIGLFAEPVNYLSSFGDLPEEIEQVDGNHCIAESIISKGSQCTLEGFRFQGETVVYGVIDTVRETRVPSCLARYQYPSALPKNVQQRMIEMTSRVLEQIGYDDAPFNVEYFWDRNDDSLKLLEINSRISQSHCPLFALVDGESHQQIVLDLAEGKRPEHPDGEGQFRTAGKFMMRVFEDGVVAHAPSASDRRVLKQSFPEVRFESHVEDGTNLADMPFQDSYSYNIADVYLGARDQSELLEKYRRARDIVPFDLLRRPELL